MLEKKIFWKKLKKFWSKKLKKICNKIWKKLEKQILNNILKKNSTRPHQVSLGDATQSGGRSPGSPIINSLHVEVGWRLNGPLMTVRHGEGW